MIERAACRLKIPQRDVIMRVLRLLMKDIDRYQGGFTLVRYQPPAPDGEWDTFVIHYRPEENELVTDLRKLTRRSVSSLVRIAIIEYLDEVLPDEGRNNYYPFSEYMIREDRIGEIRCWYFYWGLPRSTHGRPLPGDLLRVIRSP